MPKKVPGAVVVVVCGAAARNKAVTMVTWCEGAVHEAWELWYGMVCYGMVWD